MDLTETLREMGRVYRADPNKAVRSQDFIKLLHQYLIDQLRDRLTDFARRRHIVVKPEILVLGADRTKHVDVGVVDPDNGPLLIMNVRSQMSSIGKNFSGYRDGIIGECRTLQDRFPMSTFGFFYMMPLRAIKEGRQTEAVNHPRYARGYAEITGRSGHDYATRRGVYDQFGYLIVDFDKDPPESEIATLQAAELEDLLSPLTFVDRTIRTFNDRMRSLQDSRGWGVIFS